MKLLLYMMLTFALLSLSADAQQKQNNTQKKEEPPKVRVSPKAGIWQIVGLTKVDISYSRPGVKNRKIWGELVPYNKVWRAGADEATKFTFSTDVMIEGKKLSAGSYSFFVIPTEKEWTVIFNKVADQWGAFTYNEAEDALRFKVKPEKNTFHEWLVYSFSNMTQNSAVINLIWENLKVPFKIEVKI
jgi:hypothetical protein